jgi:rubrerythrin
VQEVGAHVEDSGDASAALAFNEPAFVDLAVAGTKVSGEFRCADCGYGAVVQRALPQCPMCGGTVWESRGPLAPRPVD